MQSETSPVRLGCVREARMLRLMLHLACACGHTSLGGPAGPPAVCHVLRDAAVAPGAHTTTTGATGIPMQYMRWPYSEIELNCSNDAEKEGERNGPERAGRTKRAAKEQGERKGRESWCSNGVPSQPPLIERGVLANTMQSKLKLTSLLRVDLLRKERCM